MHCTGWAVLRQMPLVTKTPSVQAVRLYVLSLRGTEEADEFSSTSGAGRWEMSF